MKIPKFLKIAGHKVKIIQTDDMPLMNGNMGISWAAYNSIKICTHFPESQQAETLLHEIIHHILNNLGYEFKQSDDKSDDTIHSERMVEAISQALFQVLRDNKLNFANKEEK